MPLTDITNSPLPKLAPRPAESHKGLYGHALVVGGSRGMSGAITLAGLATLRSGAGLVTLAVPRSIQDVVAGYNPSYMTVGLTVAKDIDATNHMVEDAADEVLALAENMTALALGPGLGRTPGVADFVARLYREVKQPMVVDADALVALAERKELLTEAAGLRILTPHPGEFARLTGVKPAGDDQARAQAAAELASASGNPNAPTIVVLKGHHTVITDGSQYALNQTGNPGMATGGTGDVLTGVITALVCQGLAPFDAARLGVHLHGRAGDLAARMLGQVSLIASDLIDYLPAAFLSANG
jgi:ADP-dependent NAD(P)H-hydrate dehydratase